MCTDICTCMYYFLTLLNTGPHKMTPTETLGEGAKYCREFKPSRAGAHAKRDHTFLTPVASLPSDHLVYTTKCK